MANEVLLNPDGTPLSPFAMEEAKARSIGNLNALAEGATFNNWDEMRARIGALSGGKGYLDRRDAYRKERQNHYEANPASANAYEFLGGMLPLAFGNPAAIPTAVRAAYGAPAQIANVARAARNTAVQGGAQGVISGFGSAEELKDAPLEMAGYGVSGAALGALVPVVGRTTGGVLSRIKDYFSPNVENKAAQFLERAVLDSGSTPQKIGQLIDDDRVAGVGLSTIMDTSSGVRALAERIAARGGESSRKLLENAEQTINLQPRAVQARLKNDLRAGEFYADEAQAVANLRAGAPTMYDEIYKHGEVFNPKINELLEDIDFASAFNRAKTINAKKAGIAIRNGEDPSRFQLKDMYKIVNDEAGNIKDFKLVSTPDIRTLDLVQQELGAKVRSLYKGSGADPGYANALDAQRKELVKYMDEATTDPRTNISKYAEVRKKYGDEKEIINAFEAGKDKFKDMDGEAIKTYYDDLSDAAKTAARTGVDRNARNDISKAIDSGSSAAKAVSGDFIEAKWEPLFESPAKFSLYKAAMKRQVEDHDHAQNIIRAAQRGVDQRAASNLNEGNGIASEAVRQAATGNQKGVFLSLTKDVVSAIANPGLTDNVAARLTELILSKERKDIVPAVKVLEIYAAGAQKALVDKGRTERMVTSGIAASLPHESSGGGPDDGTSQLSDDQKAKLEKILKNQPPPEVAKSKLEEIIKNKK